MPMTKAMPDALPEACRFRIASLRISCAGPGATFSRFLSSSSVADRPIRPRIDTTTSSAGKIERIPKYVSAAAQTGS